ncbi:unnamed protein product [Laminaria digitata]
MRWVERIVLRTYSSIYLLFDSYIPVFIFSPRTGIVFGIGLTRMTYIPVQFFCVPVYEVYTRSICFSEGFCVFGTFVYPLSTIRLGNRTCLFCVRGKSNEIE